MKKRFTEQQIAYALKQAETGTPVDEVIRDFRITKFCSAPVLPECTR